MATDNIYKKIFMKFRYVEIYDQTDRRIGTYRHIDCNTLHLHRGEVMITTGKDATLMAVTYALKTTYRH